MLDPPPPPIAHGAIVVILGFSRSDVAVAATRGCGRDGRGGGVVVHDAAPRRAARVRSDEMAGERTRH